MKLGGIKSAWLILLAALCGGCAATVYPPAKLTDPVAFYLAQYNVHSSIILPSDGKFLDYSFGDWNYAALHHKLINDALGALTISGDAAFERRIVDADSKTGEPIVPDSPRLVLRLFAERKLIARRLVELENRFQRDLQLHRQDGLVIYIESAQSEIFVKDPQHYGLTNNCNRLTADTLRALGYRVDGFVITNRFHLSLTPYPADEALAR